MFDREKQIVINRYCKAIFQDSEKISISELNALNIPEEIKHFINCEIDNQINNEFNEIKRFSKFDYENIRVKPLVDELKILLRLTRTLNVDELSLLLKLALDLTIDYLLRPCETLTSFIFKYEEFQNAPTINERLKYIKDYEYFPQLITAYIERKGIARISRANFIELMHKIDNEYTRDFTVLEHYYLFNRFKTYLLELNLYITDTADYEAFIVFLKDKTQTKMVEFLEEHKEHFRASGMNVLNYLKSFTHIPEADKKIDNEKVEFIDSGKKSDFEIKEDVSEEMRQTVVEEKKSAHTKESNEIILESTPLSENTVEEASSGQQNILFEKLKKQDTKVESKTIDRNLDGLIPKRLKKKVIKNIFDNNEILFMEFINNINKVKNWDEASLLLTDLFDRKNIQPFSKWAIRFTEFLYENIK